MILRRDFLKNLGLMSGLTVMGSSRLWAQVPSQSDHFFVLINAPLGLDVTLGLDPKVHKGTDQKDIFIEYRPEDIFKHNSLSLGPAASPLVKHAKDILTLNGVNMVRDAGHEALLDYISSGFGTGQSSSIAVELNYLKRQQKTLGVLLDADRALKGQRDAIMSKLSSLTGDSPVADFNQGGGLDFSSLLSQGSNSVSQLFARGQKVDQAVTQIVSDVELVSERMASSQAPVDTKFLSAAVAFKNGLSSEAFFSFKSQDGGELDSHTNHERRHLQAQKSIWQQVSDLFDAFKVVEFKGKSLFESTTFMVVSEFSRTPYLNGAKGKDHNPFTNSVLLAGKGVNGGSSVGHSLVLNRHDERLDGFARHMGGLVEYNPHIAAVTKEMLSYDPSKLRRGYAPIMVENVVQTVAHIMGFKDRGSFAQLNAYTIPGVKV